MSNRVGKQIQRDLLTKLGREGRENWVVYSRGQEQGEKEKKREEIYKMIIYGLLFKKLVQQLFDYSNVGNTVI